MQDFLSRHPDAPIRVLAIWEPILASDVRRPTSGTLARLSDSRVAQFWDSRHRVARRLAADAHPPQPEPECCLSNGVLWDLAALYPPGSVWKDTAPIASLFDGPVFQVTEQLQALMMGPPGLR